ncbi:MAG TPA: polysaccharide biosynthesis tyrosine autokinase [Kiloniellales bacterium]|jgi:capsular exopolysaccharide synthesis family protein
MELARELKRTTMTLEDVSESDTQRPSGRVGQIDPIEFARMLWRRKWVMMYVGVAVMLVAVIVIGSLTPRFKSTAYVEINPRVSKVVDFEAVLSGLPADVATMETEIQIIRSRKLAEKTVAKLGLERSPEFNSSLQADRSLPQLILELIGGDTATEAGQAATSEEADSNTTPGSEEPSLTRRVLSMVSPKQESKTSLDVTVRDEKEKVIDNFLRHLSVVPEGRSRVIGISVESQDPRLSAAAANTLADFYIVAQLEAKFEATKRASAWLAERVFELRDEVSRAEEEVERFRQVSGLIQGGTNATLAAEEVSDLNRQALTERTRLAEAEARLNQVQRLLGQPGGIETMAEVLDSQVIRDLRRQETEVERQVAQLSAEFGEKHPRMINARAQLADLRGKVKLEVDKVIQGLRNEVAVARARSATMAKSLEDLKDEVGRLNSFEVQLRALEREATASRALLEQLLTRSKETSSQEDFQQADASVVSDASAPNVPSFPKKTLLLLAAFVVASVFSISIALVLEYLDLGFRSMDQIERQLGVAPLGLIPALKGVRSVGKSPQDYIVENPVSAFGESIRTMHTNLLLSDLVKRPKVILLTSAMPNEGKTSTAVALGRLQAQVGQKVVIVDCDVRRPSIHTALNLMPGPGLVQCLLGETAVEDVLCQDPLTGLYVLQAGGTPPNPPDLFDSIPMQKLLTTLARKYDLVILDSAPLLAVSDTLFLARLADKTVMIVRWVRTRRETAKLALNKLIDAKSDVAGVVLSMVDVKGHAQYGFSDSGAYHGKLTKYYSS